ncbi:MAG: hypothetical protein Q8M98_03095 [Candidatus Cloacimonadaceae bacterium]|nr:hypothetical protein [Candidatus Cloacimonadaceae bacterium]MDP3113741.1 hypothetical protein [Candidatus Cloacimonadaceae bacterium]
MIKQLLIIAAILLIAAVGLFGIQDSEAVWDDNQSQPKSYDYILLPGGAQTFASVLWQIQTRYGNNEKNTFTVGLSNGVYQQSVYCFLMDSTLILNRRVK